MMAENSKCKNCEQNLSPISEDGLCTACANKAPKELIENKDYYIENGLFVFTEKYHLDRGHCCNSGCRHCPY